MRARVKKFIKIALLVMLAVLIIDAGLVLGFAYIPVKPAKSDAIVVLGAAIKTKRIYFRALEGFRLYEQKQAPVLALSGGFGQGQKISEAQYMQKVILDNFPTSTPNILLENDSHSTYDNLVNIKKLLPDADSIIIVSDRYHLARSVIMAKALGFKKVSFSHPPDTHYSKDELFYYFLREMAAMVSYLPKFIFK